MFVTPNWIVEAFNVLKDLRPGLQSVLCNLRQKKYAIHCGAGVSCPHQHRLGKRSAYLVDGIQLVPPISRTDTASDLHRSGNRQDANMDCHRHLVLIAIVKKRLNLVHSLYEILRVLDLNMFETTPISALLGKLQNGPETDQEPLQQNLFPKLGH